MDNEVSQKSKTIFDWETHLAPQVRQVELLGEMTLPEAEYRQLSDLFGSNLRANL